MFEREPTAIRKATQSQLFASGPVVFFRWANDDGWTILSVTPNVRSQFGYEPDELVRGRVAYADLMVTEDVAPTAAIAEEYTRHRSTPYATATYRLRHADGSRRFVLEYSQADEDETGRVVAYHGYVFDVTGSHEDAVQLRQHRDELMQLRLLLEETTSLARIGAWEVNFETGEIFHSAVTRQLHDVDGPYEIALDDAFAFYPEDGGHRARIEDSVRRAREEGQPYDVEVEFVSGRGRRFWVRIKGDVERVDGRAVRLFGTIQDIDDRKRVEIQLQESTALWRFALEGTGDGVWDWNPQTDHVFYSDQSCRMLGYDPAEIPPHISVWRELLHPDDAPALEALVDGIRRNAEDSFEVVQRLRHADGRWLWFLTRARVMARDARGNPVRVIGTNADITRQKRDEEARYRRLVNQLQETVFRTDAQLRWTFLNPAWESLTGFAVEHTLVQPLADFVHPADRPRILTALEQLLLDDEADALRLEFQLVASDGSPRWVELFVSRERGGANRGLFGSFVDITPHKERDERIRSLANFDPLTSLPNRRLLLDRLHDLARNRPDTRGALLLLDLDNFKDLNDTRGHDAGDALLVEIAQRLLRVVRARDSVARLGGDEFVVLVDGLDADPTAAELQTESLAERICEAIRQPVLLRSQARTGDPHEFEAFPAVSIGIAPFEGAPDDAHELLRRADLALYEAKRTGRNGWRFFDPQLQHRLDERIALAQELRDALAEGQFHLALQGQFDDTGALIGAEALLRWDSPLRGAVAPSEFIPVAEEGGQILDIGRWVIAEATHLLARWATTPGLDHLQLCVNVSAREFREPGFVAHVEHALRNCPFPRGRLGLEITESLLVEDVEQLIASMNALRALGIAFSIDDFGTGYSSLAYLKRLPLAQLKIDQSFVQDITTDPSDAAIVRTIIGMGHALDLDVIAEGVETPAQRAMLLEAGCRAFQGWYLHRPADVAAFEDMARANRVGHEATRS